MIRNAVTYSIAKMGLSYLESSSYKNRSIDFVGGTIILFCNMHLLGPDHSSDPN